MTDDSRLERHRRLLGSGTPLFYDKPLHLVRGEGVRLFDDTGRSYLDMYNNVPCVGHANPRVVEAMHRQASTLNVHSRYLHDGVLDYAERLTDLHAEPFTSAVFACTGTEAVELALKTARAVTGGTGFICSDSTYHGNSSEVSRMTRLGPGGSRHRDFRPITHPQLYRPLVDGISEEELCDRYIDGLTAEIAAFEHEGIPFAGAVFCSILANEGLAEMPAGFMERAVDVVHDAGGVFIADEVQAGFGRTGDWWGYEAVGFVPDIAVMGKPMGNGLPMSGIVASHDHIEAFRAKSWYFNTFAASPLQAAVGSAVIDEIEDNNLLELVTAVGDRLRKGLTDLQEKVPAMGDVRGVGTFIGVDWVQDRESKVPDVEGAADVMNQLKDAGVLCGRGGEFQNVVKLRPPLVLSLEDADEFLSVFADVVG